MKPIISFTGRHNSGKTTILKGVIGYLSAAGLKVALIKHSHHGFDIQPVKDAEILFNAGADFVIATSPGVSLQYERHAEKSLAEVLAAVPESMDLIIVEGFKNEALDKIEILRQEIDPEPMLLPQTIALVADISLSAELPVFTHDQIREIAEFILHKTGVKLPQA